MAGASQHRRLAAVTTASQTAGRMQSPPAAATARNVTFIADTVWDSTARHLVLEVTRDVLRRDDGSTANGRRRRQRVGKRWRNIQRSSRYIGISVTRVAYQHQQQPEHEEAFVADRRSRHRSDFKL